MVFGTNRCTMAGGTIPLPVDMGLFHGQLAGCEGYQDIDLGTLSTVVTGNPSMLPFPLPNLPGLSGFSCYGQVITGSQLSSSNALAIGIGQ